jgi:hypothetical protein
MCTSVTPINRSFPQCFCHPNNSFPCQVATWRRATHHRHCHRSGHRGQSYTGAAIIVFKSRLSHLPITFFPWSVSTAVSGKSGFLPSPRTRRCFRSSKWCLVAQASTILVTGHGGPRGSPTSPRPLKKKPPKQSTRRSTIRTKSPHAPLAEQILVADPPTDSSHLMMGPWTRGSAPWTRPTARWTFSMHFSIGK